jgi:thiol:disulfide interchange protein DsbA
MTRFAWLAAVGCFLLAACHQPASNAPETTSAAPPAQVAPAAAGKPATPVKGTAAPAQPDEVVNAGEDLETVESDQSAPASPSPLLTAALNAAPAATVPGPWKENENYIRLIPAQPTVGNLASGQVEVAEVFWYGCPHCYALDPYLEAWRKKKPAFVEFVRLPVMWNEGAKLQGRLFYTVEALGKLDAMHSAIFDEIQENHDPLVDPGVDPVKTEKIQAAFAARFGVSAADYDKAYNSFGVDQKLRRAEQLNRAYMVTGVPMIVVNGKYWTDVGHAGDENKLVALINDLATFEHRGR